MIRWGMLHYLSPMRGRKKKATLRSWNSLSSWYMRQILWMKRAWWGQSTWEPWSWQDQKHRPVCTKCFESACLGFHSLGLPNQSDGLRKWEYIEDPQPVTRTWPTCRPHVLWDKKPLTSPGSGRGRLGPAWQCRTTGNSSAWFCSPRGRWSVSWFPELILSAVRVGLLNVAVSLSYILVIWGVCLWL